MIDPNVPATAGDFLYFLTGGRAISFALAHNFNYDNSGVPKSAFQVIAGGRAIYKGVIETADYDNVGGEARFEGKIVPATSRGIQNYRFWATIRKAETGGEAQFEIFQDLDGSVDLNLIGELSVLKSNAPIVSSGFQSSLG